MNLDFSSEQRMLRETVSRAMSDDRDPVRIREAEAHGFDRRLWKNFYELGLPLLRGDKRFGGSSLGLLEAIIVCESVAEALALIPAVDSMAVVTLLSGVGSARGAEILHAVGGGAVAVLALLDAAKKPDQFLLFGAAADYVIYRRGSALYVRSTANLATASLAGSASSLIHFSPPDDEPLVHGERAILLWEAAIEEWKLCNAASIAAMARQTLVEASSYACDREAFGCKIGSFQGLSHPLADSLADVDGATLMVWRAVERIARGDKTAGALVSQASWWAAERCGIAARRAMRVFGGYGMTLDYDAQIFFRRIAAQSALMGDPAFELERAGRRLFLGERSTLPDSRAVGITFEFDKDAQRVLELTRQTFREHVTPDRVKWSFDTDDGHDPELFAALAKKGVLYPEWPNEFGGLGSNAETFTAVEKVFNEFDWSYSIVTVTSLFGKMVMEFGSEELKAEILPKFGSGSSVGALCYSEPSCGSDIFAARTRAIRQGDDWVIDGQKVFTSQGHIADYGLMLARTGDGLKHQSVTLFALPLDLPGYRCESISTVGGERTNTTFYDGMKISDKYRLGAVNGGAKILASALALEQCASELYVGKLDQLIRYALKWLLDEQGVDLGSAENVSSLRQLARVATYRDVTDVISRRAVAASLGTSNRKHFGPMGKLFGSEAWVECSQLILESLAPLSLIKGSAALGRIEKSFRQSVPGTIYAGTSEIQRSIIAEAGLGMPRSRS